MSSPSPVALALGGAAIALGLAAVVAVAPEATPRLIATAPESHGHHTYHPPVNMPYATAVDLCLDRPGRATVTDSTVRGGAPALREFGARTDGTVVVTTECPSSHGEGTHAAHGQRVRVLLAGSSPDGARTTVLHLTYTVDGHDGMQETDAILPALHQRPT